MVNEMDQAIVNFWVDMLFIIAMIVFASFYTSKKRRRKAIKPTTENAPILLAYFTQNATLTPVEDGKIGDMHYTTIISSEKGNLAHTSAIISVELPFRTKVHILGVPKKTEATQLNPAKGISFMEEVVLEGDYPNYFSLYADKGQQTESRYHLDPAAMAFTVDFCQAHHWEIIQDTLYFLAEPQSGTDADKTYMIDDVEQFVAEIRPAIEDKNSPLQDRLRNPYGKDRRDSLKCPICQKKMANRELYFECPSHDGVLIKGGNLGPLRSGDIDISHMKPTKAHRNYDITCPSCNNQMFRLNYNMSKHTIIDSCSHCPYRWLDAGELTNEPDLY